MVQGKVIASSQGIYMLQVTYRSPSFSFFRQVSPRSRVPYLMRVSCDDSGCIIIVVVDDDNDVIGSSSQSRSSVTVASFTPTQT